MVREKILILNKKNKRNMKEFRKLKKFKVLIGTPHSDVKNYCLDTFLSSVTNMTYRNGEYDVLIADNSKDGKNAKKIMKAGVQSIYVKQKQKDIRQYIADSHEVLRVAALRGNYDYLIHIESDIEFPLDLIERLLSHQKKVVGAAYFINHGYESRLMVQQIEKIGDTVRHTSNIDKNGILLMDGKLHRVHSIGLGVIAIHKSVLQKINFRWLKGMDSFPDSVFSADCNAQNIPIYLDSSILCHHNNSSWSEVSDSFDIHLKK
jgi:hypothetical protein